MRKVTATFGNKIVETRAYRNDNLTSQIATPGVTTFDYTWDSNKRKTSQNESGIPLNNQGYGYDSEDRLTQFNRNNGDAQGWGLSLVGDWNTFTANGSLQARTHNPVHELTRVNAAPLSYDDKGNLLTNSNGQAYTWDIENRLRTAFVKPKTAEYGYDALGRRVTKVFSSTTTVFVSDGLQEIAEYEQQGKSPFRLARSFVYGSYIDEPLLLVRHTGAARHKYFYHANDLYCVAALTDAAGAVVEHYEYDPYGKVTILEPDGVTPRAASSVANPWTFTGRRLDAETGLMYYRARMYSTDLGRFVRRDPIGYRGGIDLYEYVWGDPITFVDPLGLNGDDTHGAWGGCKANDPCPLLLEKMAKWTKSALIRLGELWMDKQDLYHTDPTAYNNHITQFVNHAHNAIKCWTIYKNRPDCCNPPEPPNFPPTPPRAPVPQPPYDPHVPGYVDVANPFSGVQLPGSCQVIGHISLGVGALALTAAGGLAIAGVGGAGAVGAGTGTGVTVGTATTGGVGAGTGTGVTVGTATTGAGVTTGGGVTSGATVVGIGAGL